MNLSGNAVAKTLTITALCLSLQITGLAQEVSGLEKRKAIEAEYGVKEAVTRYDTRTELMENPAGLCSDYGMYSFVEHEISPAPSGYKPFYISYFGRHGARFALSDDIYEKIHKVLLDAHNAGFLPFCSAQRRRPDSQRSGTAQAYRRYNVPEFPASVQRPHGSFHTLYPDTAHDAHDVLFRG